MTGLIASSIEDVQEHSTKCLWTCNNERQNTAIGDKKLDVQSQTIEAYYMKILIHGGI